MAETTLAPGPGSSVDRNLESPGPVDLGSGRLPSDSRKASSHPEAAAEGPNSAAEGALTRDNLERVVEARFASGRRVFDVQYQGQTRELSRFAMFRPEDQSTVYFDRLGPDLWSARQQQPDGRWLSLGTWKGAVSFNPQGDFGTKAAGDEFWQLRQNDETLIQARETKLAGGIIQREYRFTDGTALTQRTDHSQTKWRAGGGIESVQYPDGSGVKTVYSGNKLEQFKLHAPDGSLRETWTFDAQRQKWASTDASKREMTQPPLLADGTYHYEIKKTEREIERSVIKPDGQRVVTVQPDWESLLTQAKTSKSAQFVLDEKGKRTAIVSPSGEIIDNIAYLPNGVVSSFRILRSDGAVTYSRLGGTTKWEHVTTDLAGAEKTHGVWNGNVDLDPQGRFLYRTDGESFWQGRDLDGAQYQIRELPDKALERINADKTRVIYNPDSSKISYDAQNNLEQVKRADGSHLEVASSGGQMTQVVHTDAKQQVVRWTLNAQTKRWQADGGGYVPTAQPPVDQFGNYSVYVPTDKQGLVLKTTTSPSGTVEQSRTTLDLAAARDELAAAMKHFNKYAQSPELQQRFAAHLAQFEQRTLALADYRDNYARQTGRPPEKDFRAEALLKIKQTYDELRTVLTAAQPTVYEREGLLRKLLEPGWRTVERLELVEEYMFHLASMATTNVDQGPMNSCMVCAPEKFIMRSYPEQGARILKEMLFTGGFQGAAGRQFQVPLWAQRPTAGEWNFSIENAGQDASRSRVSRMLENALGSAHHQTYGNRMPLGSVYTSSHGFDWHEAQQMCQLAVGDQLPFIDQYGSTEEAVEDLRSGRAPIIGTFNDSHAWTINAAYVKQQDGSYAVYIDRDDQNNDADNFQPLSQQAIANSRGYWNGGGGYAYYRRRW